MNLKDAVDINYAIEQIGDERFDGNTIRCLFLSLRFHVRKNSLTREFGDFFAHSEKDRGPILQHLAKFSFTDEHSPGKTRLKLNIPAPSHSDCIVDDLKKELKGLYFDTESVERHRNEITICVFTLLDHCLVSFSDWAGILRVSSNYRHTSDGYGCFGVVLFSPSIGNTLLYYSDIVASPFLEGENTEDSRFDLHYRAVRFDSKFDVLTSKMEIVSVETGKELTAEGILGIAR